MTLAVLPLVPLLIWGGVGVAAGGGGTAATVWWWLKDRPPYTNPKIAYEKYVKAVEQGNYKLYQWAVECSNQEKIADREAVFKVRCDQRKKLNLAPIVNNEGYGNAKEYNEYNPKVEAEVISPWDRTKKTITIRKNGGSWQVVE